MEIRSPHQVGRLTDDELAAELDVAERERDAVDQADPYGPEYMALDGYVGLLESERDRRDNDAIDREVKGIHPWDAREGEQPYWA